MKSFNPEYLAGVFDSDGSFSISRRNMKRKSVSYVAMTQLTWKNTPLSAQFMDALVFQYGGSYMVYGPTKTEYLKYSATGKVAEKIVDSVKDFLFLKKKQAENLLKLRTLTVNPGGKTRPSYITDQLEELYQYNLSINTKNSRYK